MTTAYAALLVLIQILLENRFEEASNRELEEAEEVDISPAQKRFLTRFRSNRVKRYVSIRTGIGLSVALIAVIGEIVHGFGDLIFECINYSIAEYYASPWRFVAVGFSEGSVGL